MSIRHRLFAAVSLVAIASAANAGCPNITGGAGSLTNGVDTWSFGAPSGGGWQLLLDGNPAGGGLGTKIENVNGMIYTLGTDSNYWVWSNNTWTQISPTDPCPQTNYLLLHGN